MSDTAKPKEGSFQFSLRTLLLLTAVTAVLLWMWTRYVDSYRAQNHAAAALEELGASISREPAALAWLGNLVGEQEIVKVYGCFLSERTITDDHLEHLKNLTNLEVLFLSSPKVTDEGLAHLSGLRNLETLFLCDLDVTDDGLEHLKGLTNLQHLELHEAPITDSGLVHLKGLTNLEVLVLCELDVTDSGLKHIQGLTNLRSVWLYDVSFTGAGRAELRKALPNVAINWGMRHVE